jgi:hypothetical protein
LPALLFSLCGTQRNQLSNLRFFNLPRGYSAAKT